MSSVTFITRSFVICAFVGILGMLLVGMPASAQTCLPNGTVVDDVTGEVTGTCDPSTAAAYRFDRGGIFGCNQTGSYAMSVGTLSAVGGVYVPVNDAAITLNTGFSTYKECILDPINKRYGESASTGYVSKALNDLLTGRGGRSYLLEDYAGEILERIDQVRVHTLESGELNVIHPVFRSDVMRSVVQNYYARTRAANQSLTCPYQGDLQAVLFGETNDPYGGLRALMNPACYPIGAGPLAEEYSQGKETLAREEFLFRVNTGVYGVEEYDPVTGRYITRTPGSVVSSNLEQLVQSGFRQLENVDEIDEMVGALFSGLSSQIISDSRGLTGLLEPTLGQPSYLAQMAQEASQGLRDAAVNAAIQILSAARQVETTYLNAMNAIAATLTQTISQLRAAETSCWALVVPQAQTYANQNGFQITVATSTTFSQQVIDSQIGPLATSTLNNVERSEVALETINRLIAGVTNSASIEVQRLALQQLDALVAQGVLHNQYDAQQATQRRQDIQTAMATLVEDTIVAWADSSDPNIGWCNVNNPELGRIWAERWR